MERITEPIIDRETGEITGYRLKNTEIDRMKAYRKLGELEDLQENGELFGKWIPCSERLPKTDETSEYYDSVIVTMDNGRVVDGCYIDKEKEWWVDAEDGEHYSINATGHVVAWMPLPEPYKGE